MPLTSHEFLTFVCILVAIPILAGINRRREGILYLVRKVVLGEVVYLGVTFITVKMGRTPLEALLAGLVAALAVYLFYKPRSRHVPASVKRRARAEFELRTGKKFNRRKHEYDHDVAFSRLGSHTSDNIHVMEKRKNRSKGARSVWWDALGK